jgi:protein SCO1/2
VTGNPPDEATEALPADGARSGAPSPRSTADRAAAFAAGQAPIDRAAALRTGSAPVPRKFVLWVIAGFAILGIGGLMAEHFIGNGGAGSSTAAPTTVAGASTAAPPPPVPPGGPPIGASLNAFVGLARLAGGQAPTLALHDQNGTPWTLTHARGKVVVLTFFNSECNDICPVLADEIAQARGVLGVQSSNVEFVVVNTDPRYTSPTPVPPALAQAGLIDQAGVLFLNGPLSELNAIWSSYGVTVTVQRSTQVVTHNDIMYFIGRTGKMKLRATPFADEDRLGRYTLAPDAIHRFAQGTAEAATSVMGAAP